MMWLRKYLAVTEDGTLASSRDGEAWLRALPRSLDGTVCWAAEPRR
jgi:hypothetical protein